MPGVPNRHTGHGNEVMSTPADLIIDDRVPYETALNLQAQMAEERVGNARMDVLWLLEHNPVFTVGRTTNRSAWPSNKGEISDIPVVQTRRGGSITYHGPGQVIGYPILRLKEYCPGPKLYVRMLEEVIIRVLRDWNIAGRRVDGLPGVWVETDVPEKIASIGVRFSQGVTTHGFALNVDMDLTPFSLIVPCGIAGCRVTSMTRYRGQPVDPDGVKAALAAAFSDVFRIAWVDRRGGKPEVPHDETGDSQRHGLIADDPIMWRSPCMN